MARHNQKAPTNSLLVNSGGWKLVIAQGRNNFSLEEIMVILVQPGLLLFTLGGGIKALNLHPKLKNFSVPNVISNLIVILGLLDPTEICCPLI
jgi:hypothetical protein